MSGKPKKKLKYSIHLATSAVNKLEDFLTDNARQSSSVINLRKAFLFPCELRFKPSFIKEPGWAKNLDQFFEVNGTITSSSSAAVILFKSDNRVLACTYGHGHTMIDTDKRENDFGLLVAANSLSDENVRLVEKANLGSVIRDATQAAGITKLQEFNVDRALSLVRKLSGSNKDNNSALSGASSITMTSEKEVDELNKIGSILLKLYQSTDYKKSGFGIIDKIKPIVDTQKIAQLDTDLLNNITSSNPSFELGAPEIDSEPIGYMTIGGTGKRTKYPDISLELLLKTVDPMTDIKDLYKYRIVTHSIDGTHQLKEWSLHRGLVGSLDISAQRYALNEGKWYAIENQLQTSANASFHASSSGLQKSSIPWPIIGIGKDGKTKSYEAEEHYNIRASGADSNLKLFDRKMFKIPNMPGPGIEICDLFDVQNRKLIHIKKSGRRSSVISHFIAQGMNSAKILRTYPQLKIDFFSQLKNILSPAEFSLVSNSFPHDWTVEYRFGDLPNAKGNYTIPFFSRVTLDEAKREIQALGYKAVEVSFIRMSK